MQNLVFYIKILSIIIISNLTYKFVPAESKFGFNGAEIIN